MRNMAASGDIDLAIFLGHHKCGTRYVCNIIDAFCRELGISYGAVTNPKWFEYDLRAYVDAKRISFLCYVNANVGQIAGMRDYRAFHIIRDPRDLAISAYFSHRNSHPLPPRWPELAEHRKQLMALPFDEGFLLDLDFTDRLPTDGYEITVFKAIDEWPRNQECVMELRFEDLIANSAAVLTQAFTFVGLDPRNSEARRIAFENALGANTFQRLSGGRVAGQEDVTHHYRSGAPGDWRKYFKPSHKKWFKERYPNILVKTGYEKTADW